MPPLDIRGDAAELGKQALERAVLCWEWGSGPVVVLAWLIHAIRCLDMAATGAEFPERGIIPTPGAEG